MASMIFVYKGKQYFYQYKFDFDCSVDGIEYLFTDGNYGCDCNRSLLLSREYKDFPILNCGNEIEMTDLKIY